MRPVVFCLLLRLSLFSAPGWAQHVTSPQQTSALQLISDPQAVVVLNQALTALGGASAINATQDFKGTGTITYYWGGREVQGTVTVKGRGPGQFRLEASLPDGLQTFTISNGTGSLKPPLGDVQPVEWHNAINFGSLTFPSTHLVAALQGTSSAVAYVGLETISTGEAHHVRIQKLPQSQNRLDQLVAKLTTRDFLIDAATLRVLSISDMVHPKDKSNLDIPHKIEFANYQPVNGVLAPFFINEFVDGQHTWSIQLSQITFNNGFSDSDFQQ